MAKETAESKLLKLIEEADAKDGTASSAPAPAAPSAPAASQALSSVSSVGVGTIAVPPFIQKILLLFSRGSQPGQGFGMRQVNQLLVVLIIIIGIFFISDFSKGMKKAQQPLEFPVNPMTFEQVSVPQPGDVTAYIAVVNQRNIFRPFEKKKEEEVKIVAPIENQQIKDRVTNFKLVGISWLNSPETATVMIEDKSTTITYFLKTGEELQGVKIETIYADRVEMTFQGQKLTMNL